MTNFSDTDAGRAWIATGDSRETSERVMRAIASAARDEGEAEWFWENAELTTGEDARLAVWEHATSNGAHDDDTLHWGGRTLARVMAGE